MLTRREAVAAGVVVAGWGAVPGWARKRPPGLARGVAFEQGVAVGAPRRAGVTLWTRVAGAAGPARLGVQVAADPDFKRTLISRRVLSDPGADHTVHVRLQDPRLKPGETYWYRFVSADGGSPAGRFRVLPPRDSHETLRIGFWTCQSWTEGHYSAHPHLAAEDDLDFMVCLGDYIYEYGGAAAGGRADPLGTARTLDQYRAKYRLYRSDPGLRAMQAAHASYFLWDDHEVANNYWREGASDGAGFAARKAAGYRAWFEHQPVPRIGSPQSTRIYRSVRAGLADLFFIDDRQYRDRQPCGDSFLTPCPEATAPGRAMLG
jgi:alkaline phosphatase D